jgi:hypothetical protein
MQDFLDILMFCLHKEAVNGLEKMARPNFEKPQQTSGPNS